MKRMMVFVAVLFFLSASYCLAGPEFTVSGTYVNKADKEYMTLNPDGTLHLKLRKRPVDLDKPFEEFSGKYRLNGEDVELEIDGGGEASGKIKGNTFIDNEGKAWVKEGFREPPETDQTRKKTLPGPSTKSRL